jgi:tryptophanyl-tRNA synthetase
MRIVSGIQPTGALHLGHFLGALRDHVEAQKANECYYLIADYHALTSGTITPDELQRQVLHVAAAYLACGLDPSKTALYRQSDVPAVCELTWILTTVTSVGTLERAVAYKDARMRNVAVDAGVFAYPVLMAADILLVRGEMVPVGQDQLQHVEICRDVARRFNQRYGEVLAIPEARLTKFPSVPGTNREKMSKRYKNTIDLFATDDEIRAAVNRIETDSRPENEPKVPDTCTVFYLYTLVAATADVAELRRRYQEGIAYREAKQILATAIIELTRDVRARYQEIRKDEGYMASSLREGAARARAAAADCMRSVRSACGLGTAGVPA